MKKIIVLLTAFVLVLLFAGCGGAGGEMSFNAVILEINGSSVLVEPGEGDDIRRSADKISFSSEDLDDIGAEAGDTVTVSYTGGVMETYPAQVRAVSWSLLEKGTAENPPQQMEGGQTAEYSYKDVSMGLTLPGGWACEIIPAGQEEISAEPNERFGVRFWPEAAPELSLSLEYYPEGLGICGTGVTFTDKEYANGLTATACTEKLEDEHWFLLIYKEPYANYAVSCTAPLDLWNEYEAAVEAIINTAVLGGQL